MPQGTATGTATAAAGTGTAAQTATSGQQAQPPAHPPTQAQPEPHERHEGEKWLGMTKVQWIWVSIGLFVAFVIGVTIVSALHRETGLGYHLDRPRGVECSEQSRLVRELKQKYDLEAKAAQTGYRGPSGHWDSTRYTTELNAAMARFKASQESLKAQFGCNVDTSGVFVKSDPSSPVDKNIVPITIGILGLCALGLGGALGKTKTGSGHAGGH